MAHMVFQPHMLNPNYNVFAMLWLWASDVSQATHFDTWQDAVLALEHSPPVCQEVHIERTDDGQWTARTEFYTPGMHLALQAKLPAHKRSPGNEVFLTPEPIAAPHRYRT